jgi:hypothetical protein
MLVNTYPSPSTKYGETVCCAGIDAETRDWIRMYPVNFRSLDEYAQFKKWQFIEASWSPTPSDARPESRKVHQDTIRSGDVLPAGEGWAERMRWLEPLIDPSLETLKTEQRRTEKSLGALRPKHIKRLIIRPAQGWDAQAQGELRQLSLDWTEASAPRGDLEQLPYDFCTSSSVTTAPVQAHTRWRSSTGSWVRPTATSDEHMARMAGKPNCGRCTSSAYRAEI